MPIVGLGSGQLQPVDDEPMEGIADGAGGEAHNEKAGRDPVDRDPPEAGGPSAQASDLEATYERLELFGLSGKRRCG